MGWTPNTLAPLLFQCLDTLTGDELCHANLHKSGWEKSFQELRFLTVKNKWWIKKKNAGRCFCENNGRIGKMVVWTAQVSSNKKSVLIAPLVIKVCTDHNISSSLAYLIKLKLFAADLKTVSKSRTWAYCIYIQAVFSNYW